MVSGHDGVKARLRRAAQAILAGRLRGVPMGYLIAGPVGSAKTFLVNCFTGEIGFPCVKFLNFRSQWQGVTEGNLEKILKVLHAMWPVGVIIDEADAFLGDRNQQGDSGTSNRVFAQFASFMGNTEYRGKIVWFLITSPAGSAAGRPQAAGTRRGAPGALLPADRRGARRAVPDHAQEERADQTAATSMKRGDRRSERPVGRRHRGDPGAGRARRRCRRGRRATASSVETLRRAFDDFIPATSPLERELQILVAVQECTSREVLPERYRTHGSQRGARADQRAAGAAKFLTRYLRCATIASLRRLTCRVAPLFGSLQPGASARGVRPRVADPDAAARRAGRDGATRAAGSCGSRRSPPSALAAGGCGLPQRRRRAPAQRASAAGARPRPAGAPRIAIVGAGVAGLNAAYKLQQAGLTRQDLRRRRPHRRPHVHRHRPARRRPHHRARRRVHRQHARRDAGADEGVRPRAARHRWARKPRAQARDLLHQRPPLHPGAGRARRSCRWPRRSSRTTTRSATS